MYSFRNGVDRMQIRKLSLIAALLVCVALVDGRVGSAQPAPAKKTADPPSVKATMQYKPVHHEDVEYDIPAANAFGMCKVTVIREGKLSGWAVAGPTGQTIRRFMDTDG